MDAEAQRKAAELVSWAGGLIRQFVEWFTIQPPNNKLAFIGWLLLIVISSGVSRDVIKRWSPAGAPASNHESLRDKWIAVNLFILPALVAGVLLFIWDGTTVERVTRFIGAALALLVFEVNNLVVIRGFKNSGNSFGSKLVWTVMGGIFLLVTSYVAIWFMLGTLPRF